MRQRCWLRSAGRRACWNWGRRRPARDSAGRPRDRGGWHRGQPGDGPPAAPGQAAARSASSSRTWPASTCPHGHGAAVCAVSTLFMLRHAGQRSFVAAAARHLHPGGILFIEAFRFDLRRNGVDCRRAEHRPPGRHAHCVQPARPGRPRGQHHTCACTTARWPSWTRRPAPRASSCRPAGMTRPAGRSARTAGAPLPDGDQYLGFVFAAVGTPTKWRGRSPQPASGCTRSSTRPRGPRPVSRRAVTGARRRTRAAPARAAKTRPPASVTRCRCAGLGAGGQQPPGTVPGGTRR
jgi:hypothetical protein